MRSIAGLILAITFSTQVVSAQNSVPPENRGRDDSWDNACRGRGCDDGRGAAEARGTRSLPKRNSGQYTSCYNAAISECYSKDTESSSACQPPREIVTMIQAIAPLLQGGNPKEACTKLEVLYGLAAGLEYTWAQKCYNASDRCADECGRTLKSMTDIEGFCRNAYPLDWDGTVYTLPSAAVDACMIYNPNPAKVACACPTVGGFYDCADILFDEQKADVQARRGACVTDRTRSLTAMIEAGMYGVAAFYNDKCRRAAQESTTGPTGVTTNTVSHKCLALNENGYPKGYFDEECINFCDDPRNGTKSKCDCSKPENAPYSRCNCKRPEDKTNPACFPPKTPAPPGGTPYVPPKTPVPTPPPLAGVKPSPTPIPNKPTPTLNEDIDGGIDQEYNPAGGPGVGSQKVGDIPGGGGGGIGGFGGGGGGSGAGGGAPGEGPFKTDIDKGYGNGGGSAAGGGGGGGYPNGAGGGYGPEGDKDKMDWSKFLPKVDKARGLATDAELAANGITSANGLSNFEKVTKKMNEKRPVLLP